VPLRPGEEIKKKRGNTGDVVALDGDDEGQRMTTNKKARLTEGALGTTVFDVGAHAAIGSIFEASTTEPTRSGREAHRGLQSEKMAKHLFK